LDKMRDPGLERIAREIPGLVTVVEIPDLNEIFVDNVHATLERPISEVYAKL